LDEYLAATDDVTDAQIEAARARLCSVPAPDPRRRVVVVDPLEEIFAQDDAAPRARLFHLLGGLWSLPWSTVILCMRADFYGAVMVELMAHELESCQYRRSCAYVGICDNYRRVMRTLLVPSTLFSGMTSVNTPFATSLGSSNAVTEVVFNPGWSSVAVSKCPDSNILRGLGHSFPSHSRRARSALPPTSRYSTR